MSAPALNLRKTALNLEEALPRTSSSRGACHSLLEHSQLCEVQPLRRVSCFAFFYFNNNDKAVTSVLAERLGACPGLG